MRRSAIALLLLYGCSAPSEAPIDASRGDGGSAHDSGGARDAAGAHDGGALDGGALDGGALHGGAVCSFAAPMDTARVTSGELTEISGIAASHAQPGVLYVHNDSGDSARVFALDASGALLAELRLRGARAIDWEDIALTVGAGGEDVLWVGDTGNNAARTGSGTPRATAIVYRFAVPALDPSGRGVVHDIDAYDTITLRYPDMPHDCEGIFVDASGGALYLFAKENSGPANLYRAALPLAGGADEVLELAGVITPSGSITAADALGDRLVVRTYTRALLFVRAPGEAWGDVVARAPVILPLMTEGQGEAIAFSHDGRAIFSVPEGATPTVRRMDETCAP